jgi:hypothetical protein
VFAAPAFRDPVCNGEQYAGDDEGQVDADLPPELLVGVLVHVDEALQELAAESNFE